MTADGAVDDAAGYLRSTLGCEAAAGTAVDAAYVLARLRRPLRVCGMVKNTGEPGGGPFWVRSATDGSVTLQVVESAQMDTSQEDQAKIMKVRRGVGCWRLAVCWLLLTCKTECNAL